MLTMKQYNTDEQWLYSLGKTQEVQFAVNPKKPGLMYRTKPLPKCTELGAWWRKKVLRMNGKTRWNKNNKRRHSTLRIQRGKKKERTRLNNARQCCLTGSHRHFWIMGFFSNYFDINILLYHRWDGLTQHLKEENVGEDGGILGQG